MTDIVELTTKLRSSCYLAFNDGTNDYLTASLAAEEIERLRAALMILKGVNENEEFPSVFVEDVIESALEGK